MTFSVPIVYRTTILGDVTIEVTGSGDPLIDADGLRQEMALLLNDAGRIELDQTMLGKSFVSVSSLSTIGIDIEFDRSRLSLIVKSIPPALQPTQTIGTARKTREGSLPTINPAGVSSYLNVVANADYGSDEGLSNPDLFLTGATRVGGIVVEYDGAFTEQFGEGYKFYRRGIRAVYDRPDSYQRYSAGDLRVVSTPLLSTAFIAGFSLEKRRQIFDPFLPTTRLGGQEILLDSASSVEVMVNGERVRAFQLDAGRYNLTDLPIELGANDVQLAIRDSAGRQQLISLDYFFDPLDLPEGESEYVFSVGLLAENLTFEPDYSNDVGLVGMYRKALSDSLILGGAVQISERVQVAALSSSVVPQVFPGAFDIELGASTGDAGTGYAVRANYRFQARPSGSRPRQFAVNFDYQSANFRTISDVLPISFDLLSIGATYSQGLNEDTYINVGGAYTMTGGPARDRATTFADVFYRLNERTRIIGGIEYGTSTNGVKSYGARVGISVALGGSLRASADYRSRNQFFRANLSKGSDETVGSFGFDVGLTDSDGQSSVDTTVDYTGNRFEARVIALTEGRNFGDLTDRQDVRLQVGTSIAFADGAFGVGRPIGDSYAVVKSHPAIEGAEIITGQSLSQNRYDARSGLLGAAVQNDLTSYVRQDVQYDLAGFDLGVDIGDGTSRVEPPYRSGYSIQVGSQYYISATGFLMQNGKPVTLAVGTVTNSSDDEFTPIRFFTNSAGRFAVIGLAPNQQYEVTIDDIEEKFVIQTSDSTQRLLRLGKVDLEPVKE